MSPSLVQNYLNQANDNPFPNENVDPKIKAKNPFGLKVARAIYYKGQYFDSVSSRRARIRENRDYAAGRQNIQQYRAILDPQIKGPGNKSWLNIDWSITSPAPKIVKRLVGDMMNQDYTIQFNAIDSKSKLRKEQARDEYIGKMVRKKDLMEFENETGVKLESFDGFVPKDFEELEMHMEMTFKEAVEIAMEAVVDWTLYDNDWKRIKPRVFHDLVENNKGCIRIYWDGSNNIRIRYVDIENLITSYTDDPFFTNTEYEAEIKPITIRDLRHLAKGTLTEEQLFEIARLNAGKLGNKDWGYGYYSQYNWNDTERLYDDYRINVLDFVFYTTDVYKYEAKTKPNGRLYFNNKGHDYKKPKRSDSEIEVIDKTREEAYTGLWIIGTDYIAAYGRDKNITRPRKEGKPTPKLLHKFIIVEPNRRNGSSNSIIDDIKPNLDELMLHVLKIRQFVAIARPPGMAIDIDALNSIESDGEENWDPITLMKLYAQTGIMLFQRMGDDGMPMNGKPFESLVNGLGDGLRPFFEAINFQLQQIENNTGLSSAVDGVKPDSKALVGIQKLQMIASNNILRELYASFNDGILERAGTIISRMIQDKVKFGGGIDQYINIIGNTSVKTIDFIEEDFTTADLGIKTEALPTGEELQDLYNAINEAVANKEIRFEDGMEIKSMSPKKGAKYLRWVKKKYQEDEMAIMQQKEEQTRLTQQASIMASAEAEKIKIAAKTKSEIDIYNAKIKADKELEKEKHDYAVQLEREKTAGRLKEIEKASELNLKNTESNNPMNPQPKVFPEVVG